MDTVHLSLNLEQSCWFSHLIFSACVGKELFRIRNNANIHNISAFCGSTWLLSSYTLGEP